MIRRILHHLNAGLIIAIAVIVTVGYYNPFMGFTSGTEFKVLIGMTVFLSLINVISLLITREKLP